MQNGYIVGCGSSFHNFDKTKKETQIAHFASERT